MRIDAGQISGARATIGRAWLLREERRANGVAQSKEQELAERQTIAAEVAADAAQRALRYTILATIVALVSAVIAAFAYLQTVST
jgi:hypothetical protein